MTTSPHTLEEKELGDRTIEKAGFNVYKSVGMSKQPKSLREGILEDEIMKIMKTHCEKSHSNFSYCQQIEDLIALIKTVGTKVIGDDTGRMYKDGESWESDDAFMDKNDLRSEQRKALEDIISGKTKI